MITVRLATLQDSAAITGLHTSQVNAWERIDARGERISAAYADLSVYERWLHGGPWLSIETCAVHLNRLLTGSGTPLVAELDGVVLAETEVYDNYEAAPFDHHLSIGVLYTHSAHTSQGLGGALLDYVRQMATLMACARVTVSAPELPEFYIEHGFRRLSSARRVRLTAQSGRAFYQASELTDRDPAQIRGWQMPLGRVSSARQEWDGLFPQDWAAGIPELLDVPAVHLKMTVAGQNALVYLRQADDADSLPGECRLSCWAARPLSAPLLAALRDRAAREGFRSILTTIAESEWPLLQNAASDAELLDSTAQDVYELPTS